MITMARAYGFESGVRPMAQPLLLPPPGVPASGAPASGTPASGEGAPVESVVSAEAMR